jgi:hypothetical protein
VLSIRVGIYQLSHYDSEHIDNYRRPATQAPFVPTTTAPETAPPEVPPANPNPIPQGPPDVSMRELSLVDDILDKMVFTGMWCAPVDASFSASATVLTSNLHHSSLYSLGMWCALVDSTVGADFTVSQITFMGPLLSPTSVLERENSVLEV